MRKCLMAAVCVMAVAVPAYGQTRAASAADSSTVAANVYERLFAGVTIPQEQQQKALQIIAAAFVKMRAMQMYTEGQWQEYLQVEARRDTALARLIPDAAARARFWRHARADAPVKPGYVKPDSSLPARDVLQGPSWLPRLERTRMHLSRRASLTGAAALIPRRQ